MSRVAVLFAVVLPGSAVSLAASAGVSAATPVMPLGGAGLVAPGAGPARPWLGAGAASQHPAAGPRHDEGTPTPAGTSANAVTCVSVSDCLAVGSYAIHSGAVVDVTLAAHWNGSAWSAVPSPNPAGALDSYLNGISCISPSDCLAVGYYASGSNLSVALTLAERWNGSAWSLVAIPSPPGAQSSYLDGISCTSASDCLAVGTYVNSHSVEVTLAERWNGSAWSVVPSPNPAGAPQSVLGAVSCARASCLAVGYHTSSSGVAVTLTERWQGSAWSVVPSGNPAGAMGSFLAGASCRNARHCVAVGNYINRTGLNATLAESWDGSAWSVVPTPRLRGDSYRILATVSCASDSDCWAAGPRVNAAGSSLTLTEHWNGSAWSVVNRDADLAAISCSGAAACVAVGSRLGRNNLETTLAEHWNGIRWAIAPSRDPRGARGSYLHGISCPAAGRCLAVGDYVNRGFARVSLTESWNGTKWTIVPSPNPPGSLTTTLDGITCTSTADCMAVGTSSGQALAEHWNGSAWSILPVPIHAYSVYSQLDAAACTTAAHCLAVGYYLNQTCGCDQTLAYAWNGSAWSIVPSPAPGLNSGLAGIACTNVPRCLAVGNYQATPARYLTLAVQWTGTRWARLRVASPSRSTYSELSAITCPATGRCLAAGNYNNAARNYITLTERWNGTKWTIVPSPNPRVGPPSITYLQAISCTSTRACLATGGTGNPADIATLGERWNGSAWRIVPTRYGH